MGCDSSESKPRPKYRKGLWSPEEDQRLRDHVLNHGHPCWSSVPTHAGLQRNGKSCRLRWINYLRPGLKRGMFTAQEEDTILTLHRSLGNKWSKIAGYLAGRTDNEIKNYWHSYLKKKDGVVKMNIIKAEKGGEGLAAADDQNNNISSNGRDDHQMIISTTSSCVTSDNKNYTAVDDYVSVSPTNMSLISQLVPPSFESSSSSQVPYTCPTIDHDQYYDQWVPHTPFDDHINIHNMMRISFPRIMFTEWLSLVHNETTLTGDLLNQQAVDLETTLMYHNSPTVGSDEALSRSDLRFESHAIASPGINDIDQFLELGGEDHDNIINNQWGGSGTGRE